MLNLIPAIKAIESEISGIKEEYNKRIRPLSTSLKHLREINEACETCEGRGRILRHRCCAEDERPDPRDPNDWNTCPDCNGTGLAHYNEQQGYVHVPDISP